MPEELIQVETRRPPIERRDGDAADWQPEGEPPTHLYGKAAQKPGMPQSRFDQSDRRDPPTD